VKRRDKARGRKDENMSKSDEETMRARTRREFLKHSLAATGLSVLGSNALARAGQAKEPASAPRPFVGIQIAAHSFYDEGIEYCLDLLKETAGINGLLISSHSYYGAMGRPLEVMADHGVPKADNSKRTLNRVWVQHHDKYFADTKLRHRRPNPDSLYAGREVFADLAEAAAKRNMRLYARHYQPSKEAANFVEGFTRILARDHEGKPHDKPCWNNPDYRGYLLGTMRDIFESYPLDGLQYGAERPTPLTDAIFKGSGLICFCAHCCSRGKAEGINVARARDGGRNLCEFMTALRKGNARTPDGVVPEFLAILLRYPELLAWERLWHLSGNEVHKLLYDELKSIRPQADIGRHVDHRQSSWDLLYRAGSRYQDMPDHADFIKPILYHDILGPRLQKNYLAPLGQGVLQELSAAQSLELFYAWFGHSPQREPALEGLRGGLSPEYVYKETKRAVEGAAGRAAVYSGIGLDIPSGSGWGTDVWQSDPDEVHQVVTRAFDAGATGIVASREYEEITLGSLRVVGQAVRDAGAANTTGS
jgi:hypothetical protein